MTTRQHPSHPSNPFHWLRQWLALMALAILAACGGGQESEPAQQVSMRAQLDPVEAPKSAEMKLLVISATGTQPSYNAITAVLDQIGVPFDRLVLQGPNKTTLAMVPGTLSDGAGNGKYQGIILETGDLPYEKTTGYFPSAMTAAQWTMLWQYQRDFGVRTATLYTRPALTVSDDAVPQNLDLTYGLDPFAVTARSTNTGVEPPVVATFTPDGSQVFNYLNSTNPISIINAFTYLAKPALGANVTPLLQTSSEATGPFTIASVFTAPDGRQNLALTADSNENC
ncbi:hypothetical protein [Hydrogenophaga sp.]|uniref:Agd3-related carbohydrate-binding protein n=1 Tax=Hydrogenophaga sp. TaxID=1904254 RepID=UPI00272504FF|nr:hypothetical protein [Hydrogenophaga sp.]MDO9606600.1 hypothetical protein [Hydrogenophaga sp.]